MARTNPHGKLYVSRRPKVAPRRLSKRGLPRAPQLAGLPGDRDGSDHDPMELLLVEIEAMREEMGTLIRAISEPSGS